MRKQTYWLYNLAFSYSVGYYARIVKPLMDETHGKLAVSVEHDENPNRYYWFQAGKVTKKQIAEHVKQANELDRTAFF